MKKTSVVKKWIAAILSIVLFAGVMTGFAKIFTGQSSSGAESSSVSSEESEKKDIWRIGVTMNWLNTEQFTAMINQFQKCVDADDEFEIVSIADCNDDQLKQVEQAESIKELGVDAWIVIPASSDNMVDFVKQLNDEGTPVVCLSQGYDLAPDQRVFVGTSNYEIGEKQAEYIMDKFPDGAKVLYLAGTNGMTSTEQRRSGFVETIAERPDIEILADQAGDYSTETAMGIAEDWIQAYQEFDAVVCVNDLSAVGVAEALKGANRQGVCVVGNDGNEIALEMIRDDFITMSTAQD